MDSNKSVDSLGELTSLLKEFPSGNKTKQITDLTKSLDNLTKILDNRTGTKSVKKEDEPRTLKKDIKDFFQQPYKDIKNYFGIKNKMPENVDLKSAETTSEKDDTISMSNLKDNVTKMKGSPIQKKMLQEVIKIRSILSKSNNNESPTSPLEATTIEPNTDEEKQKERELLAQAIADKLSELGENGTGGGLGFFGGKPPVPTTVPPAAAAAGSALLASGVTGSVAVGGAAATGLATGILATEQAKPLREAVTQNSMLGAMSGDTALAAGILDANGEKAPEQIRSEQQAEQNKLKDAPWYTKMYGIGKEDYLNKQSSSQNEDTSKVDKLKESLRIKEQSLKNIDPSLESNSEYRAKLQSDIDKLNNQIKNESTPNQSDAETARLARSGKSEQPAVNGSVSPTGYKWEPISYEAEKKYGPPIIDPVKTGDDKVNYLKKIEDQNNELKDTMAKVQQQILAPMVSNKTIDNSRQTVIPAAPNPYPNSRGYNSWQTRVDGKL